jgi:cytochrome c-type biogenesis protein CcmH
MPFTADTALFWGLALAMLGIALACVLPRLVIARPAPLAPSAVAANAAVHRTRLAELAHDRANGVLDEEEFAGARADVERRLLVDAETETESDARGAATSGQLAIALGMLLPAAALGLYMWIGNPDAVRMSPASVAMPVAPIAGLPLDREALVAHLAREPRDGRAWVLLARIDLRSDRFGAAAAAYAKALDASPKVARDPGVWCEYADALGMEAGGTLAGKPRELIAHALTLDPKHPTALELAGSAAYEQADYAAAATYWRSLLAQMTAGTAARRELEAAIARADDAARTARGR